MRLAVVFLLWAFHASAQISVRDDYGKEVRLEKPAGRIVSLAPHLTELVYAAGAGAQLVGAVEHSDFPAAASSLPRVGGDARIDLEAVIALRPELIVAWPNAGSLRAVERLAELGLPVFRSEPRELDDIARTWRAARRRPTPPRPHSARAPPACSSATARAARCGCSIRSGTGRSSR